MLGVELPATVTTNAGMHHSVGVSLDEKNISVGEL